MPLITVGELVARFIEACDTHCVFGVISIHNMPILDAINTRGRVRFVPARGEAGATNMADADARVRGGLGVCITSTGTGAGNAAGALIEAMTAGTLLLHLTGQIESPYLDRDLGYIHEAPAQLKMLEAVGKAAFRIRNPETALATLREAAKIAQTPPCGPVSIEIPIDVQAMQLECPATILPLAVVKIAPQVSEIQALANELKGAQRPLLWLGGGARGCADVVRRFVAMGWGVVTSVQGRGVLPEDHPASLGAFNLQKPSEGLYAQCDAMLVVGSRLRSNETLSYKLRLPQNLYRIDANPLAENRAYASKQFVCADATLALTALADQLEGRIQIAADWRDRVAQARTEAERVVDDGLGAYTTLKNALNAQLNNNCTWVRDITLSNTMWGNRSLRISEPRAGVHALGGGIGQALAMGIGAAIATKSIGAIRPTVALIGDGGFMLNIGELACAVQENVDLVIVLMNDRGYGMIKNIQDAVYGGRHCYVDLHTPNFAQLCQSMDAQHFALTAPAQTERILETALNAPGVRIIEVDMNAWGPFAQKFAGPPKRKDGE